jgi:hypothetical protein
MRPIALAMAAAASFAIVGSALAQATPAKIAVDATGTVHADGVVVPLSDLLSPQARAMQLARLAAPPMDLASSIAGARATVSRSYLFRGSLARHADESQHPFGAT